MKLLSSNPVVTPQFVEDNLSGIGGSRWDVHSLANNPSITLKFINSYPNGIYGTGWGILDLSARSAMINDFVENCHENHPVMLHIKNCLHLTYNKSPMYILSKNSLINTEFLEKHIDGLYGIYWDTYTLSYNESLTSKFIEDHIDGICGKSWDMYHLFINNIDDITIMKLILHQISNNTITVNHAKFKYFFIDVIFIQDNLDLDWLSIVGSITLNYIILNPTGLLIKGVNHPWCISVLSSDSWKSYIRPCGKKAR